MDSTTWTKTEHIILNYTLLVWEQVTSLDACHFQNEVKIDIPYKCKLGDSVWTG